MDVCQKEATIKWSLGWAGDGCARSVGGRVYITRCQNGRWYSATAPRLHQYFTLSPPSLLAQRLPDAFPNRSPSWRSTSVLLIEDQLHVIKGLLLPAPSQPPNRPPLPEGRLGPLPPEMLIPGGKCARVEIATLVALATIDVVLPSLPSLANGAWFTDSTATDSLVWVEGGRGGGCAPSLSNQPSSADGTELASCVGRDGAFTSCLEPSTSPTVSL
jgi:hypothetical protein